MRDGVLAARMRPSFGVGRPRKLKRAQGRPGAGRTHGPPATKKAGGSYHRFGRTSGLPCAMVLTLMACSPRGPGFLAPVIARMTSAQLDLSVGRPGPHAFASAPASVVSARKARRDAIVSTASRAPRVVTIGRNA